MKNTIKAFSKQFFGAKYESAGKSLLASVILFTALCAAEFRVEIAPFIFYLTSAIFTAGVMWQVLTGRRHMETMQGLFMLPFDNRSFVFSYVWVLAAHTLITKTLPTSLGTVLCCRLMERRRNCACGLMRLHGVCRDSGGVSDVPERPCRAGNPLGRLYSGRHLADTPVGGGTGSGSHQLFCRGAVSGFCGRLRFLQRVHS